MATAAMPSFLLSLGFGSAGLGLIEGLSDGFSSFAKLLSGIYSDRLERRKPLAVIGYFMTASGMASFAFATQSWHVLLGRLFGWVGRGARTPVRNVLLTEATNPKSYGRAIGFERAMDSFGAVLGPLAALYLMSHFGFKTTFLATLIPGLIAALLIAFAVKERAHVSQHSAKFFSHFTGLPSVFREYLVGVGAAGIGDFSNTLLILWATESLSGTYGSRATLIAITLYTGYNIVYTGSCYLAGVLADRFHKPSLLAGGYAIAVIPAVFLMFAPHTILAFAFIFGFSGLYMGFWETLETSASAEVLPANVRGTGFGLLATVNGIGDLLSSIIVGLLWAISPIAAMVFVIVTSITGSILIWRSGRRALIGEGVRS